MFPKKSSGRKSTDIAPKPKPTPLPGQSDTREIADQQNTANATSVEDSEPTSPVAKGDRPVKTSKREKKYGCRMCEVRVDTAQELKLHHTSSHGIMYCKTCTKAFNNQLSLTRHEYEHKNRPYSCKVCGEDFPFESQLATHKLSHSDRRKYACSVTECGKRFKNLGDRNRHIKEHTTPWLRCPDCPKYKTKSKRDLESHRSKHSKIERYFCVKCGKGFIYNTQKIRHVNKKLCNKK